MDKLERSIAHIAGLLLFFFAVLAFYAAFVLDIRVPTCIVDKPLFKEGKVIPLGDNRYEVHYVARMWSFEPAEITVPVGSTVDFYLVSTDVTHGFHIHNTNANLMAVPGTVNYTKVKFSSPGDYPVVCHEYCGTGHQNMKATIHVTEKGAATTEVAQTTLPETPGVKLAQTKGCLACHTIDGRASVGPSFKGLFGKDEKISDGSVVNVNEDYLRESIIQPQKKIVAGFQPLMPQLPLTEEEVTDLIKFIQSLK